jgi:L-ascorbate metabolism protein UlaG (beta-lactamase superfamily)
MPGEKKMKSLLARFLAVAVFVALGTTAHAQVQTFTTSAGPVAITPIYHATARINAGGKVIYIDPCKPTDFSGMPKADLILFTHEHADHVDKDGASITALSKDGTVVIATATIAKFITQATVMANGDTKKWGDFTIEAVPAYNLVRGPAAGKFFHPQGVGNGYVITYGGKRFYFSGDTEVTPEMKALKNIDVAFLCMTLPYTMTPEEAAEGVKAFMPKIVIPYHYRATPPTDLAAFQKALAGTKIDVRLLEWYPKAG